MPLSDIVQFPHFGPLEDLALGLIRPLEAYVPGLKVQSIYEGMEIFSTPYVLVRRVPDAFVSGQFGEGEDRFLQRAALAVQVITEDPEGDEKAAQLSELIRRLLLTAWWKQTVVPRAGSIAKLKLLAPPHRVSDWATGTQVVQYATLPQEMHRYEAEYGLLIRPAEDAVPLELFAE